MLDVCLDPTAVTTITLQPVRRHGVDAAIFFSDIFVPIRLAGVGVEIVADTGPVVASPIRTPADVAALPPLDPDALAPIVEAVALTVAELGSIPLIAFAGAPFTIASYLVEGGPSKDHLRARTLMHSDPATWSALLDWVADVSAAFVRAQVVAGASAAQLFDSWAGSLSLDDYRNRVARASSRTLGAVRDVTYVTGDSLVERAVPTVHFGVGTGELLGAMYDVGVDAISVDYRIPLDEASARLKNAVPLQGNIDPALLAAPWDVLKAHVIDVLERGLTAPSHVLNLGHGVPPNADPDVLTRVVGLTHEWKSARS